MYVNLQVLTQKVLLATEEALSFRLVSTSMKTTPSSPVLLAASVPATWIFILVQEAIIQIARVLRRVSLVPLVPIRKRRAKAHAPTVPFVGWTAFREKEAALFLNHTFGASTIRFRYFQTANSTPVFFARLMRRTAPTKECTPSLALQGMTKLFHYAAHA